MPEVIHTLAQCRCRIDQVIAESGMGPTRLGQGVPTCKQPPAHMAGGLPKLTPEGTRTLEQSKSPTCLSQAFPASLAIDLSLRNSCMCRSSKFPSASGTPQLSRNFGATDQHSVCAPPRPDRMHSPNCCVYCTELLSHHLGGRLSHAAARRGPPSLKGA